MIAILKNKIKKVRTFVSIHFVLNRISSHQLGRNLLSRFELVILIVLFCVLSFSFSSSKFILYWVKKRLRGGLKHLLDQEVKSR
jgi:hypothetical protein